MAYQLQPGLKVLENAGKPAEAPTDNFFSYPQNSNDQTRFGSRPQTMLYGTAPARFGKGAPARFIDTSDELRPQSTSRFNRVVAMPVEQRLHPMQDEKLMQQRMPLRVQETEPTSSRADVQNELFVQRYSQ